MCKTLDYIQAVQIGNNVTEIMCLPCVYECYKTVNGQLRYKGTFDSYTAAPTNWLVQLRVGNWICLTDSAFQKIIKTSNI